MLVSFSVHKKKNNGRIIVDLIKIRSIIRGRVGGGRA